VTAIAHSFQLVLADCKKARAVGFGRGEFSVFFWVMSYGLPLRILYRT